MISKVLPIILALLISCQAGRSFAETGNKETVQRNSQGDIEKQDKITGQTGSTDGLGFWTCLSSLKKVHPLVIACMQLLAIVGICVLLTDNRELELYFKVDFKVPRTDILQ